MKEAELRKHASCDVCHKKIADTGLPIFHRLTVQTYGIDGRALARCFGLTMVIGNDALAQVMGRDEDLAQPIGEPEILTLCHACMMMPVVLMALIEETA